LGLNIPFLPYAMLSAKAGGNNLKEIKKKRRHKQCSSLTLWVRHAAESEKSK